MAIDSAAKRLVLMGVEVPMPDGTLDAVDRVGMLGDLYLPTSGDPPDPGEPVERTLRGMLITIGRGMTN